LKGLLNGNSNHAYKREKKRDGEKKNVRGEVPQIPWGKQFEKFPTVRRWSISASLPIPEIYHYGAGEKRKN